MGNEWDRLAPDPDVGQMSNAGFSDGSFKGMKIPSYGANSNVKCRKCGRWRWDHVGRKCDCEEPDLPNVKAIQGHLIEGWHTKWLAEALRVLVPGGIIKAFAATRTYHRLAMAMNHVGFEILGLEAWCYGSGFPKSLNVSKALDKQAGVEREVVGESTTRLQLQDHHGQSHGGWEGRPPTPGGGVPVTAPATLEAQKWEGYGTALKPAWEPFVIGRKTDLEYLPSGGMGTYP